MLPALIAAGAGIAGGLLSSNSQKKANQANLDFAREQNAQNIALQKEFAQSGIQWKVSDAEKAGIHPLFALGANTTSFSPTAIGGTAQGTDYGFIGEAGQNIGRAIDATRSTPASALALQATKTQIEGLQLDNELKRTQLASAIALANQTGAHPALPSFGDIQLMDGQGDSGVVSSVLPGHKPTPPQQTTPDLALWGRKWERNPGTSDAQSWEDVYGDENPGLFVMHAINYYRDLLLNSGRAYESNVTNKLRR